MNGTTCVNMHLKQTNILKELSLNSIILEKTLTKEQGFFTKPIMKDAIRHMENLIKYTTH